MYKLLPVPILVAMMPLVCPHQAAAEVRTWTIARDIYTAEAELVAVRGDSVYLRLNGQVEEIPVERLSAFDQQYLASLSLAPVLPGPAAELPGPSADGATAAEEMPLPSVPDTADREELHAPDLAPAFGGEAEYLQPTPRGAAGSDRNRRWYPPQPGVAANYLAPPASAGNVAGRNRRGPQSGPNQAMANSQRPDDDRGGLFGARARRLERQRAAATRER